MNKENYIERIKKVIFNDTENKEEFKKIQEIANDLRTEYQIALFEDNTEKTKKINNFMYALATVPPVESEGYEEIISYAYKYNQQSPNTKKFICRYLYDPSQIYQPAENIEEFVKTNVDMKQYAEVVLVSLFYL